MRRLLGTRKLSFAAMPDRKDGDAEGPKLVETSVAGERAIREDEEIERYGLRFQTQRKIASGGMASILHAYDPVLGRHVAVKLLHASLVEQRGEVEAFLREARITAQLEHPNIVPVYELASGPASEWACFAMKLIHGQSLAERLASLGDRRLSPAELPVLLEALLKVCDAVSYAHSARVLHLDLKPHNVMIATHGQVYVMDWGIAVRCALSDDGLLKPIDRHASLRGTLAYMAPEQLDRELSRVDQRTDVYGLGAILYELLTGRPPFEARGDEADPARLRDHVVRDPIVDWPGLHLAPGLARVAMRALARSPEERYRSIAELQADLERVVRGGGWFHARHVERGAVIVREGEPADESYIIIEGECEVLEESGRVRRASLHAGDVFGQTALFTRGPRRSTVRATSRASLLVVTRETLDWELSGLGWVGDVMRALVHRFREPDEPHAAVRPHVARPHEPTSGTGPVVELDDTARHAAARLAVACMKLASTRLLAWVQSALS